MPNTAESGAAGALARALLVASFLALAASGSGLAAQATASQSANAPATAERSPINLIVVLDVSTSMKGTFRQMQDYVYGSIVGKLLRSQDYLCLYTFGVRTKEVFAGRVEIPRDRLSLKELVYAMAPDENGTDIGLMLEKLDGLLKAGTFPNPRTSIVWATDGKNDPPPGSRYVGKDVFDPKAFDAYTILKSAAYKVLLLSIGSDTAAKDLSGPMGGEYLEVERDVTATKLEAIMGDFTSSIDLAAPSSAQRVSARDPKVLIGLVSNFAEPKDLTIDKVFVAIDGGPRTEAPAPEGTVRLMPGSRTDIELALPLPAGLSKGEHSAEVELRAAGGLALGPAQRFTFSYGSATNPIEAAIVFVLVIIAAACVIVGSRSRI
jgi:hypothetical protein